MKVTRVEKMTLAAIAVLVVAIFAVWFYRKNREMFEDPVKVTYYYLEGCPHCVSFMPEWEKFEAEAKSAGVATKKVEAHEDPEKISELGIKGFPTIMIEKGGKTVEYSGERTAAALKAAVKP